jgi:cobalt-zinc-cadmium resistance protein CzcA
MLILIFKQEEMLDKIILFSIKNKLIIGLFTMALAVWGLYSASRLPIDALPDITNNQVQIYTTSPTLAAQEVEKFITYPIEQAVKSIPNLVELRSISRFGLSSVTAVFDEDVDIYWARSQIGERIKEAEENIPEGMGTPEMSPISTGLGEIFQYTLFAKSGYEDKMDAMELRTIQDWIIKPQLAGIPGIAEVNTLGGLLKQYEVAIRPERLHSMNVTITEIFEALQSNNANTGGAYIDQKPNVYFIRSLGMVQSLEDINNIVIKNTNGIPVLIGDVANVRFGHPTRYGATTKDGEGEAVNGMVMMLKGENSAQVVKRIKNKIAQIQKNLPEGVELKPYLDRDKLVKKSIGTVKKNLIEGALIVIFILVLLMGNWRAGLIVASVIPLSLLFAIVMMQLLGVSGNLMSLGAIDFGLMVDGTVIIVEAILHQLQLRDQSTLSVKELENEVFDASRKIRGSAAFGEIIILVVYLPILTLVGIEGKMFKPMAQTVSFAIIGAFILSMTYVPMMSALFLSVKSSVQSRISNRIIDYCYKVYQPILDAALLAKGTVIGFSLLFLLMALLVFNKLGGEFIPTLEEGDIATHVMLPPGSSLDQEIETTLKAEKILKNKFPEIEQVVSKIGSAEIPTDPMPMEVADVMVILKDKSEWVSANSKEEMMRKMEEALDALPGVTTEFSQPIQMRFNELMTGVRSDVAIKIFGEDIDLLAGYGDQVKSMIQGIKGIQDTKVEAVSGLPQINVKYNNAKLAAFGLKVDELNKLVRTGFAGEKAGVIYEGEKRFDLVMRLEKESRQDIHDLKNLLVSLPYGRQIPLEQVAEVTLERGFAQISRENGMRRIVIGFNVRGRDVESIVKEIQARLESKLSMPPGYFITYGGQFQNLTEANQRLTVAVPLALGLVFVLLYFTFGSISQSILIFTAIPLSAIGGVFALWIRGMPFSISAGVGFVALFGVSVLNGIVLISYFNQLKKEGVSDILQRIRQGTKVRLRPVIMTAGVASLGFLPMAFSTGAGAEVQKPLATVVIGGLISATLLTLVVLPLLYYYYETIQSKKRMYKTPFIVIFFIISCSSEDLLAQNSSLQLDELLQHAEKNNLNIQIKEMDHQVMQAMEKGAFIFPMTDISAQLGQNNSFRFDGFYSIEQNIPNPKLISAVRRTSKVQTEIALSNLDISKQELRYTIRDLWNEIQYLMALEDILLLEDSINQQFVNIASLKFKTGEGNLVEKNTAEVRKLAQQQNIQQTRASLEIEKMKLAHLVDVKETSIGKMKFKPIEYLAIPDSTIIQKNPLLLQSLQQVEYKKAEKDMVLAEALPDIKLGYFIQSISGPQEVDGKLVNYNTLPRFQGFQVGISIPILGRKGYGARENAQRLSTLSQEKQSELIARQLQSQFGQSIRQYLFWKENVSFFEKIAVPNARSTLKNATKAYESGEIGYVEYAQVLQTSLEIQRSFLEAIRSYNKEIVLLQYITNQ